MLNSIRDIDEARGLGGIRHLAFRSGLGRQTLHLLAPTAGPGILTENASLLGESQGDEFPHRSRPMVCRLPALATTTLTARASDG